MPMQEVPPRKRAAFEAAIETRLLYEKLLTVRIGETISYAALGQEIGHNVQHEARHFLNRARLWAEKRDRILFDCVTGEGLVRVNDPGVIGVMQNHRARAHGHARRGIRKSQCAVYEKLTSDERRAFNTERAQLGLTRMATSEKTHKQLAAAAHEAEKITPADAMRVFANRKHA